MIPPREASWVIPCVVYDIFLHKRVCKGEQLSAWRGGGVKRGFSLFFFFNALRFKLIINNKCSEELKALSELLLYSIRRAYEWTVTVIKEMASRLKIHLEENIKVTEM